MQIGILSDTHDNVDAVERATNRFAEEGVEVVEVYDDFVAPPVIPYFKEFEVHGVLDNKAEIR